MPTPKQIRCIDDLNQALGKSFVIFCGSAISYLSGGHKHKYLPSVEDVKIEFLKNLAQTLRGKTCAPSYYDKTLARYADLMVGGRYSDLRNGIKFEDFLWRIGHAWKDDEEEDENDNKHVKALLRNLFLCKDGQFNQNHSAISFLLIKDNAIAVLTTNFDNGIEVADPALNSCRKVHPYHPPVLGNGRCLLKLHGDVIEGIYHATTPRLLEAQQLRDYEYIESLCKGRVILVVGYSGYGDIDIVPHLKNVKAVKIWMVRNSKPPPFATYWFKSDLESEDPGKNWLLGIARSYGWRGHRGGSGPKWTAQLTDWLKNIPTPKLRTTVHIMFDEGPGSMACWPILHLQHLYNWSVNGGTSVPCSPQPCWAQGIPLVGVSAYDSALKYLELESIGRESAPRLVIIKGLTYWRRGRLWDALKLLGPFAVNPPAHYSAPDKVEVTRIYLEVARDLLRSKRTLAARKALSENLHVDEMRDRLLDLKKRNFEPELLSQIVELDLKRVLGEQVDPNNLQEIYDRACDCQSWNAAEAAGRVLVALNIPAGAKALWQVNKVIIKQHHWKRSRKSLAAVFYALLNCPLIIDVFDGRFGAGVGVKFRERRYKRKCDRWRLAYNAQTDFCE